MMRKFGLAAAVLLMGSPVFAQSESSTPPPEAKAHEWRGATIVVPEIPEARTIELEEIGPMILGVEGHATEMKQQDDGTIVREVDLGDGRTMKIVITSKAKGRHGDAGPRDGFGPAWRTFATKAPDVRHFEARRSPDARDPGGFDVRVLRGEVREHMHRALQAFDRARAEFIRAYEDMERGHEPKSDAPKVKDAERGVSARKLMKPRVIVERGDAIEPRTDAPKKDAPQKTDTHDVQIVRTAPSAARHAQEIDALRKEIKELETMIRELKAEIGKKKE